MNREGEFAKADKLEQETREEIDRFDDGRAVTALALLALRRTVLAAIEPPDLPVNDSEPVERWCRVELFGHRVVYGLVREAELAGHRFLEVVEPEIESYVPRHEDQDEPDTIPERSKVYHPNAIYAIEDIGEKEARDASAAQRGRIDWSPHDDEDEPF